ncbi:hypothetical protein [Planctomycetes bacterium K23_9]|uniref:NHL repeat protein n=1 Tax=Stieleria marina TaxID=1930275 RepID=A0A517NNH4_9BACT|nr:NHL repeat protein [Planctomycetes bacterium K23_9]
MKNQANRRRFLQASAAIAVATPAIFTSKRTAAQGVIGTGDLRFTCQHLFPTLPEKYSWQTTHNVAVDPDNNLYVIHEGKEDDPEHPSIFVFDSEGKFIRAFGQQFQGGGHGLEVRVEGSTQFLYVTAYQQVKSIAKMSLTGEVVWERNAPMKSGKYAEGEAEHPERKWGRDRFMPTNFAFLPDQGEVLGDVLLADGYGSYQIHRYDSDGNWKSCFGGVGKGKGTFNLPHGIWVDDRDGGEPEIVIADRANNTLQTFSPDGAYQRTIDGFGLPANVDTYQDLMLVPELVARVSILDRNYNTISTVGDDRDRILADKEKSKGFTIRTKEDQWQQGKFVHPHDACFDREGNIYVAEWVSTGRVSKLTRA